MPTKSKQSREQLTVGSIPRHVADMAIPASIGLFFQTMYNVVDSFYAGEISTGALAALGLSFPVYLLVIAAGSGLSRAASALIANAIGAEDSEKQNQFTCQAISLGVLLSVVLAIGGFIAAPFLFGILGAEGELLDYALSYMNPIFCGASFFVLLSICNAILIANGDSRTLGGVLVVGFFLNLVLDPWFLYGGFGLPAMGITGIAVATVVIQAMSSLFMLSVVVRRGLLKSTGLSPFIPNLAIFKEIIVQAIPAGFNTLSVALSFFIVNFFLKEHGEEAIAAFGVTTRIEQIGLMPTFGLYAAILALVGQNNGAKKFDRVRATLRFCNLVGVGLSMFTSAMILIFLVPLLRIFTDDPTVIEIGIGCAYVIMFIQWSYVLTSTHLATLQAIKKPFYGFFETILRKIALPLLFIVLLDANTTLGIHAIWIGLAVANVLMTGITILFAWSKLKQLGAVSIH